MGIIKAYNHNQTNSGLSEVASKDTITVSSYTKETKEWMSSQQLLQSSSSLDDVASESSLAPSTDAQHGEDHASQRFAGLSTEELLNAAGKNFEEAPALCRLMGCIVREVTNTRHLYAYDYYNGSAHDILDIAAENIQKALDIIPDLLEEQNKYKACICENLKSMADDDRTKLDGSSQCPDISVSSNIVAAVEDVHGVSRGGKDPKLHRACLCSSSR